MFNPINSPFQRVNQAFPSELPRNLNDNMSPLVYSTSQIALRQLDLSRSETTSIFPSNLKKKVIEVVSSDEELPITPLRKKKKSTKNTKPFPHVKLNSIEDELQENDIELLGIKWQTVDKTSQGRDAPEATSKRKMGRYKKNATRVFWYPEEDKLLTAAVKKFEKKKIKWRTIGESIEGRSAKQCRDRWTNFLDPELTQERYQTKEIDELFELVNNHERGDKGYIPWSSIHGKYNEKRPVGKKRSQNSLKNTYNSNKRKRVKNAYSKKLTHLSSINKRKRDLNNSAGKLKNFCKEEETSPASSSSSSPLSCSSPASRTFASESLSTSSQSFTNEFYALPFPSIHPRLPIVDRTALTTQNSLPESNLEPSLLSPLLDQSVEHGDHSFKALTSVSLNQLTVSTQSSLNPGGRQLSSSPLGDITQEQLDKWFD